MPSLTSAPAPAWPLFSIAREAVLLTAGLAAAFSVLISLLMAAALTLTSLCCLLPGLVYPLSGTQMDVSLDRPGMMCRGGFFFFF